ncbi:MAG: helix-turn-helix transcriptional regulator [Eubacteriales bacterium]|nr:helix-turn-helix transcriptional regulator [Eubacteriales bacterium]
MTLGENITRLRTQKGWSQGDLADALDISRQSISKWETDSSVPELDKLLKLSELFGVTLDALVRGERAAEPNAEGPQTGPTPHTNPARSTQKLIGVILLCFGALVALAMFVLGGAMSALLYSLPFFACAIVCFATRSHVELWCAWAVFFSYQFYMRYGTGISWRNVLFTFRWTYGMNYIRLALAWVEFALITLLIVLTLCAYRKTLIVATRQKVYCTISGWALLFVLHFAPFIRAYILYGKRLRTSFLETYALNYSEFSRAFEMLSLPLFVFLLTVTLAMLRWKKQDGGAIRSIDSKKG